jgi:hypothetical protein
MPPATRPSSGAERRVAVWGGEVVVSRCSPSGLTAQPYPAADRDQAIGHAAASVLLVRSEPGERYARLYRSATNPIFTHARPKIADGDGGDAEASHEGEARLTTRCRSPIPSLSRCW